MMPPRKIEFPPLPGTEDEQWEELANEFGISLDEIKQAVFPSWMFDKGLIDKWDVRKILLKKGYKQITQPEEEDPEKTHNEWLEKHPFTKKWYETCPGLWPGDPGFDKPKHAEIINPAEKIDLDKMDTPKPTKKEIKINNKDGRAGAYYSTGDDRFEELMEKKPDISPKDDGAFTSGFEDVNDIYDDQPNSIKSNNVMKAYEKEILQKKIKNELEEGKLTPEEEKAVEKLIKIVGPRIKSMNVEYKSPYEKPECQVSNIWSPEEENMSKNMVKIIDPKSFDGICSDLMDLHSRKNKDYGNAAHKSYLKYGIISYVMRLSDKMNRLDSLTKPGATIEVNDESLIDTFMDMAAYSIMAIESLKSGEKE